MYVLKQRSRHFGNDESFVRYVLDHRQSTSVISDATSSEGHPSADKSRLGSILVLGGGAQKASLIRKADRGRVPRTVVFSAGVTMDLAKCPAQGPQGPPLFLETWVALWRRKLLSNIDEMTESLGEKRSRRSVAMNRGQVLSLWTIRRSGVLNLPTTQSLNSTFISCSFHWLSHHPFLPSTNRIPCMITRVCRRGGPSSGALLVGEDGASGHVVDAPHGLRHGMHTQSEAGCNGSRY